MPCFSRARAPLGARLAAHLHMSATSVSAPAHTHAAGRDCATDAPLPRVSSCQPQPPNECPWADPTGLPADLWSGGSQDWAALQAIRLALAQGNASAAPDPWPNPAACNASAAPAGTVCDGGRVVGFSAAGVFNCSSCGFGGHPWRPVPEFALLTALRSLDLSNLDMQGARRRGWWVLLSRHAAVDPTLCAAAARLLPVVTRPPPPRHRRARRYAAARVGQPHGAAEAARV